MAGLERSEEKKHDHALLERIHAEKAKLYGIAYSYMRNEADALEAVQETVCRVWQKRHTLRNEQFFSTWMVRILIRVCLDAHKKRKRERPMTLFNSYENVSDRGMEERLDMERRLDQLPARYRMIVILKYYQDMTISEIAELTGKPAGTIKTWIHKALKQLRVDWDEKEGRADER